MEALNKEVLKTLDLWLSDNKKCWLATVVKTWGSSPRPEGSLFACTSGRETVGSLSGGCVEEDLIEKLIERSIASKGPAFHRYGETSEEAERFNLPCGGSLDIVIEPLENSKTELAEINRILDRLDKRSWVTRRVELKRGKRAINHSEIPQSLQWDEESMTMEHTIGPMNQLFIIGAGAVSVYVAEIAKMLDYGVILCDPREEVLNSVKIEGVRKVCEMPDDAIEQYVKDEGCAIVALTHDPRIDDMGLIEAFNTPAFYIGAMGSERTSAKRRERLIELGALQESIERLHAPIGISISSKTPAEIAVSVMAEITYERGLSAKKAAPSDNTKIAVYS